MQGTFISISPAPPSFQGLGDLGGTAFNKFSKACAVSADGAVVVGESCSPDGTEAFRWTRATGMVGLGSLGNVFYSKAWGVSANGTVVVGQTRSTLSPWVGEAFRWTQATGMVGLGVLREQEWPWSAAIGVSRDGSVVVGSSSMPDPLGDEAFRWSQATGMVGLGYLPGGDSSSSAYAVSADGSVVVGVGLLESRLHPFRWTQATGMMGLGSLPGIPEMAPWGVSADGAVVVGGGARYWYDYPSEAFRWSQATGMVGLGFLPGIPASTALGVSANGSVVVGFTYTPDYNPGHFDTLAEEAFIWNKTRGMRKLRDVLVDQGLETELAGWKLRSAHGISADGLTIVGWGTNPSGQVEAWRATRAFSFSWEVMVWFLEKLKQYGFPHLISSSLIVKLNAAFRFLEEPNEKNYAAACDCLEAFLHEVKAQRGKMIMESQADVLMAEAQRIIESLRKG